MKDGDTVTTEAEHQQNKLWQNRLPDEVIAVGLYPPIRRTEPGDLGAQVNVLKQLQDLPAFVAGRSFSKKDAGRNAGKSFLMRVKQRLIRAFK